MRIFFNQQDGFKNDSSTSWNMITKKDLKEKIIKELIVPLLVRIVMLCLTTIFVIQNLPVTN
ncbi:hypothetical protein [Legionella longbeachae]|uniref:hypothetical protein n=1 Tax=Legionella longbeachae TaxID=450 RepID=UPI0001BEB9A0|nr:hypothetical protein [Legionella longbeachae]VEE02582.1 Uncharacterised protein [Legionella oakridgensis]HBD7398839.1 hypothetical protein [Legionella pneumophila]ARB91154.1 hypothetical protein A6J40_02655 [Legionella longbeachae]ARM32419.1 hypothetical protein B0B39_02260 [Legionella longbeachae]EEZ94772.1 hypothetical protein LLB_3689 [Legionella longbeachae D-4968]